MATLDLDGVDEIIEAHSRLRGGRLGAPKLNAAQKRQGAALNRAAMVTLASVLEAFIEEVFLECIPLAYPEFGEDDQARVAKQIRPPNTTDQLKIKSAFLILGVPDVFDGLRWQKCSNETVRTKLKQVNQLRNCAAHGRPLTVDGAEFKFYYGHLHSFRAFGYQFGERFLDHSQGFFL